MSDYQKHFASLPLDQIIPLCEPRLGPDPDRSKVFYANPPSHDFLPWLIVCELMRREHKSPPPLEVSLVFHDGMLGKHDFGSLGILDGRAGVVTVLDMAYSNQMVANVLRPAIGMIGAVPGPDLHIPVNLEDLRRHCEYGYHVHRLVDAARAGYTIPQWLPPAPWARAKVGALLQGERPVVVTLREAKLQPQRNSRIPEWIKFAEAIEKDHPVIFLRDTNCANFPMGKWRTWPLASTDVRIRHALYMQAFCNLFVSNGPVGWCMFSDAPFLQFKQLVPELLDWDHGNAKGWRDQDHIEIGQQWPWSKPWQRLTWLDDTFENIIEEFHLFEDMVAHEKRTA